MSLDTGKAKLPGLPTVNTGNAVLDRWIQSVAERLEVREGARGNAAERVVLVRDLKSLGLTQTTMSNAISVGGAGGDLLVAKPDGTFAKLSVDGFSESIRKTKIYHELKSSLDDPDRLGGVPEAVRALIVRSLTDEAAERGADIRRLELKQQTATDSLAYTVDTVAAAVEGSAAGYRDVAYASATANRAIAGQVLQVEARLDKFTPDGSPGTATIEETFKAVADRAAGLEATYTIKTQVTAGGVRAAASIGVSSTLDPAGAADSAVIIMANRFAVVTGSDTFPDPNNPPADRIPFGVDSSGVYINGRVRINASGQTIESVSRTITLSSTGNVFNVASGGSAAPSSITITAALNNGLTGAPAFSVISGSASLSGSGLTRTLAYAAMGSDRVIVRASVTMSGQIYSADLLIYKAYDGSAGTQGATGSQGAAGAQGPLGATGTRGSVTRYGSLSGNGYWYQADYNTADSLVGYPHVIGDTVTLSNSYQAITKYWSGGSWVDPGVVIDGNLLVNGTVSAARLAAGAVVAGSVTLTSAAYTSGQLYVSNGSASYDFWHYSNRYVVGMVLVGAPAQYNIVSSVMTYADYQKTTIGFSVFNNSGLGYTGSMFAAFAYL